MIDVVDVLRARRRIAPYLRRTPFVHSAWLSDAAGTRVSIKLESAQLSNSFKSRGAFNAVIARREQPGGGPATLVTASAGNHGRALAAAAETFGIPLTVFTPADAPATKLDAIRRHGATLRAEGRDYDHAELLAKQYAVERGAAFISPYSDPDVIAGAGTVALEIFEDAPDVDTIVAGIGGAGLISGVGTVARHVNPACRVVGVEVEVSCAFQTSVRAGHLVDIVAGASLADGLGGNPDPETITFAIVQRVVDDIVTVSEAAVAQAIAGLVGAEHLIAEGAGAVGTAALLTRRIAPLGSHVAVVLSGSNIDAKKLTDILTSA
jgi:threonine dehydratase